MISGTFDVEDRLQSSSHGRVSGCNAKNLLFNCGVMDGRAEEESPVLTGLDKLRLGSRVSGLETVLIASLATQQKAANGK
jgi:hypothetical protein